MRTCPFSSSYRTASFPFSARTSLKSASARAAGPTCRDTTINALASPLPYYYYDCEIVMLLYKQLLLAPRVYYCHRYIIRARNKNVPKYFANKGRDVNHEGARAEGKGRMGPTNAAVKRMGPVGWRCAGI